MGIQQNNSVFYARAYDLPSDELLTKFYSIVNKFPPVAQASSEIKCRIALVGTLGSHSAS